MENGGNLVGVGDDLGDAKSALAVRALLNVDFEDPGE
jgi:hypothetical protein